MKLLIALLFISACFLGGGPYTPSPKSTDKNSKLVASTWLPNTDTWEKSPWYRSGDIVTPSRVIIASDDYGCVLDIPDVIEPRSGEYYICKTGWRYPQKRNGNN